jgi:hypothetical protein
MAEPDPSTETAADPWSERWPALAEWIGHRPTHPLRHNYEGTEGQDAMLTILDGIMQDLDEAELERLQSKRNRFAAVSTFEECMDQRTELLVADMLLRADVRFEFLAEGGKPQPDIQLLDTPLRLEITSRWTTQFGQLQDELEADLAGAGFEITFRCAEHPVRILESERRRIREEIQARVAEGEPFEFTELIGTWRFRQSCLMLKISGTPSGTTASRADIQVTGAVLTDHLNDVELLICDKLTDEAKNRQAEARPTMLIVEAARAGIGWIRSDEVWKRRLPTLLEEADTKFVALGLMFIDNVAPDVRFFTAVRPECPEDCRTAIAEVEAAMLKPTSDPRG